LRRLPEQPVLLRRYSGSIVVTGLLLCSALLGVAVVTPLAVAQVQLSMLLWQWSGSAGGAAAGKGAGTER